MADVTVTGKKILANIEKVVIGIVLLSLLPILLQYWQARRATAAVR